MELAVISAVGSIVLISIVSYLVTSIQQASVSSKRSEMATDVQTALNRINDDVRMSNGVQYTNIQSDPNAPTSTGGKWMTSANRLVLVQTPRNSTGAPLYTDGTGTPDSIVYYLKDGSLYRRFIASTNPAGNRYTTITCGTATTEGGCPTDVRILTNVTQLTFTYRTTSGVATTDPTQALNVSTAITTSTTQARNPITSKASSTMSFRTPSLALVYTNAPFASGPGGISLGNNTSVYGNSSHSVYTTGRFLMDDSSSYGTGASPLGNFYASNKGCGTGASYGASCSPAQPIRGGMFATNIYANKICAADQINTNTTSTPGPLANLEPGCVPATLELPPFNKSNHAAKMIDTATDTPCALSCVKNVPADTKYTGNFDIKGSMILNGDVYITGNLTGNTGEIKVADGITKRPVVVVNGRINLQFIVSHPNAQGITPILMSFYSWDAACSNSDTCITVSPNNVYMSTFDDSSTASLTTRGGLQHAISVNAAYATGYPTGFEGSLYAYFGAINITGSSFTGTMAAQQIYTPNSFSTITLTNEQWPL